MTVPEGISAISYIESQPIDEVDPADVQAAINELVPGSEDSATEAEVILGIATCGLWANSGSEDWDEVTERARKIFQREASLTRTPESAKASN